MAHPLYKHFLCLLPCFIYQLRCFTTVAKLLITFLWSFPMPLLARLLAQLDLVALFKQEDAAFDWECVTLQ